MNASEQPVLSIRDLRVAFHTDQGRVEAVKGIDLQLGVGEVVALVGESGSGKSVTSLAVMGLLPATAEISGRITLGGKDLTQLSERELNRVRGADVSMVFQEPMTALNPTMRIGDQVAEAILNHSDASSAEAQQRAVRLLERVGIPEPATKADGYPHEMSGGQRQRVVIAIALACEPRLIIADEPTTALDVTVQAEILDLLRDLAKDSGTTFLLVTHNMGVVADIADQVAVMYRGELVETGPADQVLVHPRADYTTKLLRAVPALPSGQDAGVAPAPDDSDAAPVLDVAHAKLAYHSKGVQIRALDDVSLRLCAGQTLGLVGESGSGKSTLGRVALGLEQLDSGTVTLLGESVRHGWRSQRRLRSIRARVGVVFQDPGSSIDPRITVGQAIAEPMLVHPAAAPRGKAARDERVRELLEVVELPAKYADRYPHELSGGQRQRIGIARAVALRPELLVADEPTSALDVSVQATVLRLLKELQARIGFACLFISHDLAVVHQMSDLVSVLRQGRVMESGPASDVLLNPQEQYSRRLVAAVPVPEPQAQARRRKARLELAGAAGE